MNESSTDKSASSQAEREPESEAASEVTTDIAKAVAVLGDGGLVAFPTETVYGLGADASNDKAVRRIFALKGRPSGHPLIVHIGDAGKLDLWARDVPASARLLAGACWPGPLTLVLRRSSLVSDVVTGGRDTVGLRVPSHPVALELLSTFGGGVAAPSANRFGRVSPTTAAHVAADLGAEVDLVLDGGPCEVGVESTIVDLTGEVPMLLRQGGISAEMIEGVIGCAVETEFVGPVRAPGMPAAHYAPTARVVLIESGELRGRLDLVSGQNRPAEQRGPAREAESRRVRVGVLAPDQVIEGTIGEVRSAVRDVAAHEESGLVVLAAGADARAYAHNLYACLRNADGAGVELLLAVPPSGSPDGADAALVAAVRDRLTRAAASGEKARTATRG